MYTRTGVLCSSGGRSP